MKDSFLKNKYKILLIIVSLALVGFTAFLLLNIEPGNQTRTTKLAIEDTTLNVEVVDTPEVRTKGLSERESLGVDEGMWFVFNRPERYHFHMLDMNFPIDIIWVNQDMAVVDVTHNVSPDTYPDTFAPSEPVQYVLEVNAGFALENGVEEGSLIEIIEG